MSTQGIARGLDAIAQLGVRNPMRVVLACGLVLALCAAAAATLRIDSSRHSMVRAEDPHQARQLAFFDAFGYPNTLVVVLSGAEAEVRHAVADAIAADLAAEPGLTDRVLTRLDRDALAELVLLQTSFQRPPGTDAEGYLSTADGAHTLVLVFPDIPGTQQAEEVRPMVERVRAARDRALRGDVTGDVTGAAALVVDEQAEIQRGVMLTSGATGAAIVVLLAFGFRSVRAGLLALAPVVLGVVGTMAVARLLYGELNMVTSSCSSILLGLGIDFGVYLLRRYGELREGAIDRSEAIVRTVRRAGVALVIGATTTAAAFMTTGTTAFTAYARLGVIVSVGLLFMLVATLVLLPALFTLIPPEGRAASDAAEPKLSTRSVAWIEPWLRRAPKLVVGLAMVSLVASVVLTRGVPFNTRFYDFIPAHVEAARGLQVVESDPYATPLRATVPAGSIEDSRALAEQLRALPSVGAVFGPADALPPLNLAALRLRMLVPLLTEAAWADRAYATATAVAARGAYAPEDLPPVLRAQFVSLDGTQVALEVLPAGDLWDPAFAQQFHDEVAAVAPAATGLPMSIHVHLTYIREGFMRAAGASALLVLLIVALAFRRVKDAAWTLLPCATGFFWMTGTMGATGMAFDAANIVALPLILGVSIDANVHLMHRVRESEQTHGVARLSEVVGGTGSAVVLASGTTMVGFAALMLADYGAMQSLGLVMTIGIASSLLASVVLLPCALLAAGRMR